MKSPPKTLLHIHGNYSQDTLQVTLAFVAPPEVTLSVSTRNYDTSVDKSEVERVIKQSIRGATTSISLPSKGGYLIYSTPSSIQADQSYLTSRTPQVSVSSVDTSITTHSQGTADRPLTSTGTSLLNNSQGPQIRVKVKSPLTTGRTTPQDRRLLVKIIKANGLSDRDFGCTNPYCVVTMDNPHQSHTTSVVKNTVNPFWDEHFIFDFDDSSRQVRFEVYDRERPSGEDFLGRATIAMDELRRLPNTRQIIPLIENPHTTTTTSGSITIELLFVDSGEAARLSPSSNNTDTISPRRRIETNTRITPGGAIVKMTTTTTEKPKDHRVEPFFNDAPHPVERPEGITYQTDYSPYNNHGSHLEAHDAALSASPASTLRRGAGGGGGGGAELENGTENIIDVALRELRVEQAAQHKHPTPSKTSTIIITGVQKVSQVTNACNTEEQMHEAGTQGEKVGGQEVLNLSAPVTIDGSKDKKKSSFANTLKKRFSRPKKRSQSADRAYSSSFKESSLLKPPEHADSGPQARTAEDVDGVGLQEGNLRKARSQSFSSSLRRLFKKKKKEGASRESSISRGGASGQASREGSVSHPSPHLSYRDDLQDYTHEYSYSSSMPASASPLSHPH
ncbi:hypothetical protein LSH36_844g00099 [Paralvinella palmiformis]|uniref:C2 domain-containing protein n=1 Tax=Paralvinella palmiformis TaxID=53620 RepID=A0AAD9IZ60_9ANNE|nr:hypothetical protein LSH36_844g00099 [Paralvinella palmiformis]